MWKQINTSARVLGEIAFADFTGNGRSDVFRADGQAWYISEDGTSKWKQINTSARVLGEIAFADFTGNGRSDVFRADGQVLVHLRGWHQQVETDQHVGEGPRREIAIADFTGIGRSDVFRIG